jgi:hypothetical protein
MLFAATSGSRKRKRIAGCLENSDDRPTKKLWTYSYGTPKFY